MMWQISAPSETTTEADFWLDVARFLEKETRHWWGAMDVCNGLWQAMRAREADKVMVSWSQKQGVELTPDVLAEWAAGLSDISSAATTHRIGTALGNALRHTCGLRGGVLLATRRGRAVRASVMAYSDQARAI